MNAPEPIARRFRVTELKSFDRDMRVLRIEPTGQRPARFSFAAGQFVRLRFAKGLYRDYSIANAPDADGGAAYLEFHVRLSGGPGSRFLAEELRVGDTLEVEGPHGTAFWRTGHPNLALLIAGGSGLAPMLAIAEAATAARRGAEIALYIGLRDAADLYCRDRLDAIARENLHFRYELLVSEPPAPDPGWREGLLGDAIRADFLGLSGAKAYLAGPGAMIAHTVPTLLALGIAAEDIHSDGYDG